jgi:phosphoribosylglycinamide formyltransferase-1
MKKIGVLASGRGSNFAALVEACRREDFPARVACLVSDRPEAPALEEARRLGVPAFTVDPGPRRAGLTPQAEAEIVGILRKHGCDLVCLAGFMRILKKPLLEAFPGKILNIHPSLLPAFPGLDAQEQAWSYGVKVAGCTVHIVDRGVDTGPILVQRAIPVDDVTSSDELARRILEQEHRAYAEAVRMVATRRLRIEGRRIVAEEETRSESSP